ncbi:MAG: hypothetical protein PHW56_05105 [Methanosarcinaceae archaeon]|nr:hypothetical protein [Methanosarcinaceae archaeon]
MFEKDIIKMPGPSKPGEAEPGHKRVSPEPPTYRNRNFRIKREKLSEMS